MLAWVESVGFGEVLSLAFLPSLLSLGLFYGIRSSPWSFARLVSLAPLGPAVAIGVAIFQDLARPGVKEYLGVGGKKTVIYGLILLIPVLTTCFLIWQDAKTRHLEKLQ